jgi:hypothetical protein
MLKKMSRKLAKMQRRFFSAFNFNLFSKNPKFFEKYPSALTILFSLLFLNFFFFFFYINRLSKKVLPRLKKLLKKEKKMLPRFVVELAHIYCRKRNLVDCRLLMVQRMMLKRYFFSSKCDDTRRLNNKL